MAANIGLLLGAGHIRETFKRFRVFYAATIPGIFCGTMLLGWVDQTFATRVLGVITILYVTYVIIRPNLHLPSSWEMPLQLPVGLLNGFLTGLTGSQIMPLLPYMFALNLDADRFVQAVNIAVVTASLILILSLTYAGLMTWQLAIVSAIGVLPALLGAFVGNRIRSRMPSATFRTVVLLTLFAIGFAFLTNINTFFSAAAG